MHVHVHAKAIHFPPLSCLYGESYKLKVNTCMFRQLHMCRNVALHKEVSLYLLPLRSLGTILLRALTATHTHTLSPCVEDFAEDDTDPMFMDITAEDKSSMYIA